jgi:uncharacterized protein (TIGR03435 family)
MSRRLIWRRGRFGGVEVRSLFAVLMMLLNSALTRAQERSASTLQFEVASIKKAAEATPRPRVGVKISGPRVTMSRMPVWGLIQYAYQVKYYQVITTSKWAKEEPYDILAKAEGDGEVSLGDVRLMMQSLLADRFQLKFHREPRVIAAYALVVGKGGPKFKDGSPDEEEGLSDGRSMTDNDAAVLSAKRATMALLADFLTHRGDRPVIDKTGLPGKYEFKLSWTVDRSQRSPDELSPMFAALQQQLGLKLESREEPVTTIIVDRVERPLE